MATKLYTVDEAALRLNTTTRFIRRLVAERRIAVTRLGRHVRIESDVLEEFIVAGRSQAAPPIPEPRRNPEGTDPDSGTGPHRGL